MSNKYYAHHNKNDDGNSIISNFVRRTNNLTNGDDDKDGEGDSEDDLGKDNDGSDGDGSDGEQGKGGDGTDGEKARRVKMARTVNMQGGGRKRGAVSRCSELNDTDVIKHSLRWLTRCFQQEE